jgi:hypothetical protein
MSLTRDPAVSSVGFCYMQLGPAVRSKASSVRVCVLGGLR